MKWIFFLCSIMLTKIVIAQNDDGNNFMEPSLVSLQTFSLKKTDSIQIPAKKTKIVNWLLKGYYWQNKNGDIGMNYAGLVSPQFLTFNTVDGWVYKQSFSFNTRPDSNSHLSFNQDIRYAFNRKVLMGASQIIYDYAPEKQGKFSITAKSGSTDFNEESGINQYINTITSLFFRRSRMKLFSEKSVSLINTIDLTRELNLMVSGSYLSANALQNHSDYSFLYRKERNFSTNIPENTYFISPPSTPFKSFDMEAQINFSPRSYYKYINRYNILVNSGSPTFSVNFKVAIPGIFQSDASYQFIEGGIAQQLELKKNTKLFYEFKSGVFLNVNKIFFSDYQHFNTQPLNVVITDFDNSYQLLNYYRYSTSRYFAEGHLKYSTMYLFLKYLPWIRDHFWTENLYFNYLNTPSLKHYTEFGYGLGQLVFLLNVDVFASFESGSFRSVGLKLCIGRY